MSLTFTTAARANRPRRNVAFIYAGNNYSLSLQKDGRVFAWGVNLHGVLGDNSITNRLTPVSVLGATKTFCKVRALLPNAFHSLAIDKNGRLWTWGLNNTGQLGNNSTTSQRTPVSVLGAIKTFCHISGNSNSSFAIDKNGRVWSWGFNSNGELGNNSTTSQRTPISVLGAVKTFCKISSGSNFTLVIDKNGRAWGWGPNGIGQLGDNSITNRLTPVSVAGAIKTFCEISVGFEHVHAIDKNGRLWAWGSNYYGELGNNSTTTQRTPVSVLGAVKTFCKISNGLYFTLAIDKNGRAWAWGDGNHGRLGNNSITSRRTPVSVLGAVKTFCEISAGENYSLAIDKNGRAWGWGYSNNSELGTNGTRNVLTPKSVIGTVKTFCQITAGPFGCMTIDKNGRVWGWGNSSWGQLGYNSTEPVDSPVSVLGAVKTFCHIASGNGFTLAIDKNGRAWSWGKNSSGELGDSTITSRFTPVSVAGAVKTFCKISAGANHSLVIDKNGRGWSWGNNVSGEGGSGSATVEFRTPVSIGGAVKTFCEISGGKNTQNSSAIDKNGRAWSWGGNGFGQLGDNSVTSKRTPVSVAGTVKTFCKISVGGFSVYAIDKNGRAWGWGYNRYGALGDNSTISQRTPVSVLGSVKTFCHISAGQYFAMAIDKNGRAWGWGYNISGQLGDNSFTSRLTPVSVAGAVKTFCKIEAFGGFTIAIDKNGRAWGWGSNSNGNSGNLAVYPPPLFRTPVQICNI